MSVSGSVWSESVSDGNVGVISGEMCKPGALDARKTASRCRMVNEEVLQFSTNKALSNATGDGLSVRQSREKENINYGGVSETRNLRIGLDFALSEFHIHHGPGPEINARAFFCSKTMMLRDMPSFGLRGSLVPIQCPISAFRMLHDRLGVPIFPCSIRCTSLIWLMNR